MIRRSSKLHAFAFSLLGTITTAGAVDLGPSTHLAVPGDYNGDGRLDVLYQPFDPAGQGGIVLQDDMGELTVVAQGWDPGYLGLDWSTAASTVTTADLNGDGQDDVLVQPTQAGNTAAVLVTDPTAQLLHITQLIPAGYLDLDWSSAAHQAVVGDFDGDGQKEILLQGVQPGAPGAIVHADTAGHLVGVFQSLPQGFLGRHWDAQDVALYAGDFNGDGRADLLLQVKSPSGIPGESAYALLLADGDGHFTQLNETWGIDDFGADWNPATHTLIVEDANGDGIMDITLRAKDGTSNNYSFLGNSQGSFSHPDATWTGTQSARDYYAAQQGGSISVSGGTGPIKSGSLTLESSPLSMVQVQGGQMGAMAQTANGVGELRGTSGVNGGSASYSIPIVVAPGRAGMQPSLALSYSSRGGNGEMGMGWSLSGLSAIHRCPATLDQDGYVSGVTYSTSSRSDRLCLDGQHLLRTGGINGNTSYGHDGAVYRTELESFVQVTEHGDINDVHSWFEVDYQNGRKAFYGYGTNGAADSNYEVQVPQGLTTPLVWSIGQEQDTAGNNIVYQYQWFGNGEYHIASILYTGRSTYGDGTNPATGSRSVQFTYTTRSDPSRSYLAGGFTDQTQILTSVDTYANSVHIRAYGLYYSPSNTTNRSLLQSAQECAYDSSGNQSCLPATNFTWQNGVPNYQPHNIDFSATDDSHYFVSTRLAKDYVGTGVRQFFRTDYDESGTNYEVRLVQSDANLGFVSSLDSTSPAGTALSESDAESQLGLDNDFNGDGATDSVEPCPSGNLNNCHIKIAESVHSAGGLAFSSAVDTGISTAFTQPVGSEPGYAWPIASGDFTGDGRNDIIAARGYNLTNPRVELQVFVNPGAVRGSDHKPHLSGTFQPQTGSLLATIPGCYNSQLQGNVTPYLQPAGDMDGNGVPDLFVYSACNTNNTGGAIQGVLFLSHDSNGIVQATYKSATTDMNIQAPLAAANGVFQFMDINGDGLPDIVYPDETVNGPGDWFYQLNKGDGTFGNPVDSTAGSPHPYFDSTLTHGDIRNDGRDALLYVEHTDDDSNVAASWCIEKRILGGTDTNVICDQAILSGGSYVQFDNSIYHFKVLTFDMNSSGIYVPTYHDYGIYARAGSQIGDVNGDGETDVYYDVNKFLWDGFYQTHCDPTICQSGPGLQVQKNINPSPDLMTVATTGFGVQSTWEYKSLAAIMPGSSYTPGATDPYYTVSYPCTTAPVNADGTSDYFCFASSMLVVSTYQTSNGKGGMRKYTYGYQDAIYSGKGRGFQGFNVVKVNDIQAGLTTTTTFRQDYPFTGQVTRSDVTLTGSGTLINRTDNVLNCSDDPAHCDSSTGGPATPYYNVAGHHTQWPHVVQSTVTKNEANGSLVSTTVTAYGGFDFSHGHVGTTAATVTDASGVYTTTATPVYTTDGGNPCQDEVVNQTVSSTVQFNSIATSPVSQTHLKAYTYNSRCQVTDEWDEPDTLPAPGQPVTSLGQYTRHTSYAYDEATGDNAYGNLTGVTVTGGTAATSILSRTTTTDYSNDGYFPKTVTNALGQQVVTTTIQRYGVPSSVVDPNGVETDYTYDNFGRKVSSQVVTSSPALPSLPALPVQNITYAASDGDCSGATQTVYSVKVSQAGQPTKVSCYDMFNREVRTSVEAFSTQGSDIYVDLSYDKFGHVVSKTEPYVSSQTPAASTTYVYDMGVDPLNRLTSSTDNKGVGSTYTYLTGAGAPFYSGLDTQVTVTPPDSPTYTTYTSTNSLGKMLETKDAQGMVTHFRYDADGNPTLIQEDSANHGQVQILATYNKLGQKTDLQDPDMGHWQYQYDVLGELTQQTDANGHTMQMSYDLLGRMRSRIRPEGTDSWCYDTPANTNGSCPLTGLVSNQANVAGFEGKASNVLGADGYQQLYAYDGYGRPGSVDDVIGTQHYVTTTTYDADGRVDTVTYPSSVANAAPTINMGADQVVPPSTPVTLNGPATDTDGPGSITYHWVQTGGPAVTLSGTTGPNPTFTTTSADGVSYSFALTADDGLATSASVNSTVNVPAKPATPGGLATDNDTNHDGIYNVSWNAVTVPGQTITYHLEEAWGTDSSGPSSSFTEIYSGSSLSTSVSHTANTRYYDYYRVRAQDISGYSSYSGQVMIHVVVKPAPTPTLSPGGINVVNVNTAYTESWTSAGPKVTSYELQESKNDNTFANPTTFSQAGTSKSFTKTVGGNDFYYRARACNSNDSLTVCSAYSNTSHITINDPHGGGGQMMVQGGASTTAAPTSGTTAAPTSGTDEAPAPATVEEDPTVTTDDSSDTPVEAAPGSGAQPASGGPTAYMGPVYDKPVYQAWAGVQMQQASNPALYAGLSVRYTYSGNGYMASIQNAATGQTYWKVDDSKTGSDTDPDSGTVNYYQNGMDARGNVTDAIYGVASSGAPIITSHYAYAGGTGYLRTINSGTGTQSLQNLEYEWFALGNLKERYDHGKNIWDVFTYDTLNRLTSGQLNDSGGAHPAVTTTYEDIGNIASKSDVGTYTYGVGAGPHAVTGISGGTSYGYDLDGNMTNRNGTALTWNSDNLPISITKDSSNHTAFLYAPDKHRYKQTATVTLNGITSNETTLYANGVEIVSGDNTGKTHNRYLLSAYGKDVAEVILDVPASGNPTLTTTYMLTDHIGSVDVVTDANGSPSGTPVAGTGWSYDAFGKRRSPATWLAPQSEAQISADRQQVTHRGFTGHEDLDGLGLVHMNGRVYDSSLGRFLSVDPVFQFPSNTQSLNPYSYVLNNPLSMTDPTGYSAACAPGNYCFGNTNMGNRGDVGSSNDGGTDNNGNKTVESYDDTHKKDKDSGLATAGADSEKNKQVNGQKAAEGNGKYNENVTKTAGTNSEKQTGDGSKASDGSKEHLDKDKFAKYLDDHKANASGGNCAKAVRQGLDDAGVKIRQKDGTPIPDAGDYGAALTKLGAVRVGGTGDLKGYKHEKGDITVFNKNTSHPHGHIEGYDGKHWVSDWSQNHFIPYKDQSDVPTYTIYRFPDSPPDQK